MESYEAGAPSYVRGPHMELDTRTAHQVLAATVEKYPNEEALVVPFQSIRHTWRA